MRYPPLPRKPVVAALALACALGAFTSLAHSAANPVPPPQHTATALVAAAPAGENRALRQETVNRNVTLADDLVINDAGGEILLTLPAGTVIGRDKSVTRYAAPERILRRDARFKDVVLHQPVAVADPRNGERMDLPAGTVVRFSTQQRFDTAGDVIREAVDLRAALPDGTLMRIRDRSRTEPASREWVPPTARAVPPTHLARLEHRES
jgi:hypothetical protein